IARNVWRDQVRADHRLKHDATHYVAEHGTDRPFEPSPDSEADDKNRELRAAVDGVLARLPASQREAFVLLRYEEMTVREAAHIWAPPTAAVKLRAFRAYEALRAALRRHSGDDRAAP